MTDLVSTKEQSGISRQRSLVLPVTAATLFLSAFLLFSVQPFFAKMVLPRLGGSPAVWSVAMVFFQSVLLAGYGYAHFLTKRLSLGTSVFVHLIVLALAAYSLPISIPDGWQRPPLDGQSFWLIGLFCVAVGLPFFAVSANGPLLQAWFAKTGHPHARDPYFLYGASNIGSFASLILFVVLIEPLADLRQQGQLWTIGFLGLMAMIAACGFLAVVLGKAEGNTSQELPMDVVATDARTVWRDRLLWTAYAFLPSALLVAVTAHVSTDVAAAPFLWIAPLALFLLTFVIVFQKKPIISHGNVERLMPVMVIGLLFITLNPLQMPILLQITLHYLTFFAVALCAHGAIAARRPDVSRLTEFYFAMSIGGVLGGIFASFVSMNIFSWIAEYPLLLIASLTLIPALRGQSSRNFLVASVIAAMAFSILLAMLDISGLIQTLSNHHTVFLINGVLCLSALYFLARRPIMVVMLCSGMFANTAIFLTYFLSTISERSFFGVVRIVDDSESGIRKFLHGTTLHGATRLSDLASGSGKPLPLTYYTADGGITLAIEAARKNYGGKLVKSGVIGVGAGSLACQFNNDEALDFYEIDPAVVRIAKDPKQFRFLSECGQNVRMIVGDGRIEVADVASNSYGTLVIDAFSSDSIPVHLMTREAIDLFMHKVDQDGLLVLHISNHQVELESVVAAIAQSLGLSARIGYFEPENSPATLGMAANSIVAVLARDKSALRHIDSDSRWRVAQAGTTTAWTDGYSNLLASMWRAYKSADKTSLTK
jgi:hypothetical protein